MRKKYIRCFQFKWRKALAALGCSLTLALGFSVGAYADLNSGLVGYYAFNGNAHDSSANGHDGTENGGLSYLSGQCNNDQAASFNGADAYVTLPNESAFDLSALTLVATIKVPDLGENWIISKGFNFGNFTLRILGSGSYAGGLSMSMLYLVETGVR